MEKVCAICGGVGKLTKDHVPPKGVMPCTEIELDTLLPGRTGEHRKRVLKSPVFKTLCSKCNSGLLGGQYDPALKNFAEALIPWVRSVTRKDLILPREATVDIRQSAVARAVVGHLLAADERSDAALPNGKMLEAMRAFFLGESVSELRVFVWPYMGDLVILKSFLTVAILPSGREGLVKMPYKPILGHILKFDPVAFWVVWDAPDPFPFRWTELSLKDDSLTQIKIPLLSPSQDWPERPLDHEAAVFTEAVNKKGTKPPRRKARSIKTTRGGADSGNT